MRSTDSPSVTGCTRRGSAVEAERCRAARIEPPRRILASMPLYRLADPVPPVDAPVVLAAFDGWVDAGTSATSVLDDPGRRGRDGRHLRPRPALRLPVPPADPRDPRRPALVARLAGGLADRGPVRRPRPARADRRRARRPLAPAVRGHRHDPHGPRHARLDQPRGDPGGRPAHARRCRSSAPSPSPASCAAASARARPGSCGCPSAALSMLEMAVSAAGIPAVGYFAQIPHYVQGPYALASVELMRAIERHLDVELPRGDLADEARQLRTRLDAATAADEHDAPVRRAPRVDGGRVPAARGRRPDLGDRALPARPERVDLSERSERQ